VLRAGLVDGKALEQQTLNPPPPIEDAPRALSNLIGFLFLSALLV